MNNSRLPKVCRENRCPNKSTASHGYCEAHKHLASWGKYQQERGKSMYNSARWRNTRAFIMKRDKGLCQACLKNGRVNIGTDCDHIVPVAKGGSQWSYSNLQMLCRTCHNAKTAKE